MLKLVIYPDPILRQVCEPVTEFGEPLQKIVDEMFEVMLQENGLGLSANQVGINKRMFVTNVDHVKIAYINPVITNFNEEEIMVSEGCLSFPGITVRVPRKVKIDIEWQDINGNKCKMGVTGFASIVLAHELDHLNGVTFIDLLSKETKTYIERKLERMKKDVH